MEGECSDLSCSGSATDPSPCSLSSSSHSGGAQINSRDQDCASIYYFFSKAVSVKFWLFAGTCKVQLFQEQHSKQKLCKIMRLVLVVFCICEISVFDTLFFRL